MTSLELAAFCQGHGGRCTCHPDYICETDHGVVSYCDGTCSEARWAYREYLLSRGGRLTAPAASSGTIALEFTHCQDGGARIVRFEGADAQTRAIDYVRSRLRTHVVAELPEEPNDLSAYPELTDLLYPTCEHGLSAELCWGPEHYPTRDQEMARGW